MNKERVVWIDWMRVIACFMVMIVHSTEPFYLGGEGVRIMTMSDAWWVSSFEGLVRMCVPLFIIASSYLQFPLHCSSMEFLCRRSGRILVPFVIWSLFYAVYWGNPSDNLRDLLWNFNYTAGHLWFVYMLIGIYLLMPLLSPWARNVGKRELQFYLVLCLFASIIPLLRDALSGGNAILEYGPTGIPNRALYPLWGEASWNAYGTFYYFSGFIGYLLLGVYIRRFPVRSSLCIAIPVLVAGFAVSFVGFLRRAYILSGGHFPLYDDLHAAVWLETTLVNDTISVALMTFGWVLIMKKCCSDGLLYRKLVLPVSKAGYGMYLSHMVVLSVLSGFLRDRLGTGQGGVLGIWTTPLQIITTAFFSFIIVAAISVAIQRIPRVGRYIMG